MSVETVTVVDGSAAVTATQSSNGYPVLGGAMAVVVDATAVSGTSPTLDVTVEYSADGENWTAAETPQAMTQLTATGIESKRFNCEGAQFRLVQTIGGTTPSFTYTAKVVFFD